MPRLKHASRRDLPTQSSLIEIIEEMNATNDKGSRNIKKAYNRPTSHKTCRYKT